MSVSNVERTLSRPIVQQPDGKRPAGATAALVLADGLLFWGKGAGVKGVAVGEVCFNTSITGYQEILGDPSYAGQIITFTFPHIGNVGANDEDTESIKPAVRGCVLRADITDPANWRATGHFNDYLKAHNLVAITDVDTRKLTRHIRDHGAPVGAVIHDPDQKIDATALKVMASTWPGLEGMDLTKDVTCSQAYSWHETVWSLKHGFGKQKKAQFHVVVVDFGAKHNILRCLSSAGCRLTVVPAHATATDILAYKPDGVFLSNGPGDPAATGKYAVLMIQDIIKSGKPLFGICLGHQLLSLALGAKTYKMHIGHRGGNQPVKNLETGCIEITSQNHGFVVDAKTLPAGVIETHRSLFDSTLEGIKVKDKPIFSVQYHPEASPGPHDSQYLFKYFVDLMIENS